MTPTHVAAPPADSSIVPLDKQIADPVFVSLRIAAVLAICCSILIFGFGGSPYTNVEGFYGTYAGRTFYSVRPGAWWVGIPLIIVGAVGVAIGWNRPSVDAQHAAFISLDRDRIFSVDESARALTHMLVRITVMIFLRPSRIIRAKILSTLSQWYVAIVSIITVFIAVAASSIDTQSAVMVASLQACVDSTGLATTGL
jgi:hypothetical protein